MGVYMGRFLGKLASYGSACSLAVGVGLCGGLGAYGSNNSGNTGPHAYNKISSDYSNYYSLKNNNNVNARNSNRQYAYTGSATVWGNTGYGNNHKTWCNNNQGGYGGSAYTGNSWNRNNTGAAVAVHNNYSGYGGGNNGSWARISDTGPHSYNSIRESSSNRVNIANNNNVSVSNTNSQYARSGNAYVSNNTYGGSASTGNASNSNSSNLAVAISNQTPSFSGSMSGLGRNASISDTGPFSNNSIYTTSSSSYSQTNNNNVNLTNTNYQSAVSGNATVSNNTHGGSASTGNASNSNSTDLDVSISNN
jgi:hypothetical protein